MDQNIQPPPQTPPPPAQPVTPPPPQKKNSGVLIGIFLLLLGIAVGLVLDKTTLLSTIRLPYLGAAPTPLASPKPTAEAGDPTADWKTYTSTDYSFKYPENWGLTEQTDATGKKTGNVMVAAPTTSEKVGAYTFNIFITDTKLLTASSYVQSLIAKHPVGQPGELKFDTQTQITFGGQAAVELTNVFAYDRSENEIFVLFNGKIYELSFPIGQANSNIENAVANYAIANQILSTFKFAENEQASNLPTGWTYYKDSTCNVTFPVPPAKADADNRTWQTGTNPNYDFMGFFKGKSVYAIHRNPTEASGFVSGFVEVGCGLNTSKSSLEKLNADFHAHLTLQTPQNTASETLVELTSNKDITMWGMPAKEMTFVGGMFDPNQKYYLLVSSGDWYLITKKSDSTNPEINQQTNQIFSLLKFTN